MIRLRLNFHNILLYSFNFPYILLFTLCYVESERIVDITRSTFGGERRHEVFGVVMGMNVPRQFACIMSVELSKRLISSRCGADHLTWIHQRDKAKHLSTRLSTVLPSLLYTNIETLQYSRIWFSTSKRENIEWACAWKRIVYPPSRHFVLSLNSSCHNNGLTNYFSILHEALRCKWAFSNELLILSNRFVFFFMTYKNYNVILFSWNLQNDAYVRICL